MIVSPLRYPGGKSRAVTKDATRMARRIREIKEETNDGRVLFERYKSQIGTTMPDFERAVRFFILNRISFSGTVDSGGYSEGAYRGRFTDSSIKRLVQLGTLLEGVRITNEDYKQVIQAPGSEVLIFLDPPYFTATKSRLYGVNGTLHTTFDHDEFAREMARCSHHWLITYDNSTKIRENFEFAYQYNWELQYGMNNYGRDYAPKGRELLITNYEIPETQVKQMQLLEKKSGYRAKQPKR
ncbi:MAG TPA: DNA adenine methylase [Anaerolineae bacterium]|nr:DNA adenine methylase [Anaerolineae bacterium]